MSVIHQLYCTHCTYRTSALHRRDDAVGDQVFEYSTRAGSVPREKCHDAFRLIEPALYFHLPADTPQTEFLRFTAKTAPRRLFFLPAISGTRLVAHVCYRQTDTRGRPGSYFAHVFTSENKSGTTWSALDAIMLWDSPHWVTEDSASHPPELPPIESLTTIPGHGASINENVLRSFLTTPANGYFNDPGNVIPPQWRQQDVSQRRQLLIDLLSASLVVEPDRHEKIWLVSEESLAALLYYGVFRLLPPLEFVNKLSFSTFESQIDRPAAVLVATRFHKAETDLPEDAYRSRGFAINTFNNRRSPALRPALYAVTVIQKFLAPDGSRQVNELLQRLAEAKVTQGKDLEQLLAAEELIPQIVSPQPGVIVTERQLPSGREARKIVQRGVAKALCSGSVFSPSLRQIAQSPERVSLLIELLSGAELPEADVILRQLLQFIPADDFIRLMTDKRISKQLKIDQLAKIVRETQSLPPGYESLLSSRPELGWPDHLLDGLLTQLSRDEIEPLLRSVLKTLPNSPAETMDRLRTLVMSLSAAATNDPGKRELLPLVVEHIAAEPSRLNAFLVMPGIGEKIISQCGRMTSLESCFRDTLKKLPHEPSRFLERLRLLQVAQNLALDDDWHSRFNAWQNLRRRLDQIAELLQNRPSRIGRLFDSQHEENLASGLQGLLTDAPRALPLDDFPEDYSGERRAQILRRIIQQLVPPDGLSDDFLRFEQLAAAVSQRPYHPRSTTAAKAEQSPSLSLARHPLFVAAMALTAVALVVGVFAPRLPGHLYNNLKIFVFGEPNDISERTTRGDQTRIDAEERAIAEKRKKDEERALAEQKKKDEEGALAEQRKKDEERALAERRKKDEERALAEQQMKKKDDERAAAVAAAAAKKEREGGAAEAEKKAKWPPKFLTLPDSDSHEQKQLFPWTKEPDEPISLRGIDELNAHLEIVMGKGLRPMFVVEKDASIGTAEKPLVVKWAADRMAYLNQPAATVAVCQFQKTAEGLDFVWHHSEGDSLYNARQMLRLCCLESGEGEKAVLIPLLPDSDLLAEWIADYQDDGARFAFKRNLRGTEAFTWVISRGQLQMEGGEVHNFTFAPPTSLRSNSHEFKWSDTDLANRLSFGDVEFSTQVVTISESRLRVSASVIGSNTVRKESPEYQKNFSELVSLLKKVLNETTKPYKNAKGNPTKEAPKVSADKLAASDFNQNTACLNWTTGAWEKWTDEMESVMRRLSPDWKKPERPKPLEEDPKWEPVQRDAQRLHYAKNTFTPWAIRELIYPAVQLYQSRLAKLEEKKNVSDKSRDFPKKIERIEINELVRYVNQRPVIVASQKKLVSEE